MNALVRRAVIQRQVDVSVPPKELRVSDVNDVILKVTTLEILQITVPVSVSHCQSHIQLELVITDFNGQSFYS